MRVLITCEHGGNSIPREYRGLFRGFERVLASHRGYDPGALQLARDMAAAFGAPLVASTVSRLLVELNRSPGHPALLSERTRSLDAEGRRRLMARYYDPYRRDVQGRIADAVAKGSRVLHVSCHSFTPELAGVVRNADVGLLYDPRRSSERTLSVRWSGLLRQRIEPLRVRRNYPYRGYADGLTTFLRRQFADRAYAGIEIEVNQRHALAGGPAWRTLRRQVIESLADLLQTTGQTAAKGIAA